MGIYLSARELAQLESAEHAFASPVPTQIVSNGEFNPLPQTHQQQQVEGQIKALADKHAAKLGMDRRHAADAGSCRRDAGTTQLDGRRRPRH
jgi:hypothetical protein